jgi:hypothetical protein
MDKSAFQTNPQAQTSYDDLNNLTAANYQAANNPAACPEDRTSENCIIRHLPGGVVHVPRDGVALMGREPAAENTSDILRIS